MHSLTNTNTQTVTRSLMHSLENECTYIKYNNVYKNLWFLYCVHSILVFDYLLASQLFPSLAFPHPPPYSLTLVLRDDFFFFILLYSCCMLLYKFMFTRYEDVLNSINVAERFPIQAMAKCCSLKIVLFIFGFNGIAFSADSVPSHGSLAVGCNSLMVRSSSHELSCQQRQCGLWGADEGPGMRRDEMQVLASERKMNCTYNNAIRWCGLAIAVVLRGWDGEWVILLLQV